MSNDTNDFEEWQHADEAWRKRVAAGENPGERPAPPLPPAPDPADRAEGEEPAKPGRRRWWQGAEDAACCASCGCGLADLCDANLRVILLVLLGLAGTRSRRELRLPAEFSDDPSLSWGRRRGLAALRAYKHRISARTPNVCTQPVSCSAYAARAVRQVGPARAVPRTIRRLRFCAATARRRSS